MACHIRLWFCGIYVYYQILCYVLLSLDLLFFSVSLSSVLSDSLEEQMLLPAAGMAYDFEGFDSAEYYVTSDIWAAFT